MRTVFSYAKPYKWPIAIALVLMLLELSVELIQPLLIAKIIDEGIVAKDITVVWTWGAVMMSLAFVAFAAGAINSFFAAHAAQSFAFDLRQALFSKVQAFTMTSFLRFPSSGLITRLTSDVTMAQNVLFMGLRIMLRAPLLVIGSLLMAFIVNAKLALFLVIGAPFLVIFLWAMTKKGVTLFALVQQRLDRVNRIIQENLQAVRLIKAYLRGNYEASRFAKVADSFRMDNVKAMRLMELILPVLQFIMNISLMAVLWFGAIEISEGSTQVGELVAIVNYAMRMTGAFSMFSFLIIIFSRAKASSERMEEVLLENEGVEKFESAVSLTVPQKGSLQFNHVSFRYPGHHEWAVKDVSFSVAPGEKLAIMGATGSGKSTLLQLIPRMFEPEKGRILIGGTDSREWPLTALRETIGYVPQQSILFTGSVLENLAWGKRGATVEQLTESAQKAQIHHSVQAFPKQYETRVGQKGVNLSGGQKQRLSIARALVRKPSILLFDDSTSALDVNTEAALWEALEKEDATMLVVTQKIRTAQGADKIIILDEGQVVGYGTHEELLEQSVLYQKIADSQLEGGMKNARHS